MSKYGIRIIVLVFILPTLLHAEDEALPFYGGLGMGIAQYRGDNFKGEGSIDIFEAGQNFIENTVAVTPYFGCRMNRYLSFEARYIIFREVEETYRLKPELMFANEPNDTQHIKGQGFTLAPVFEYPFSDSISALGTVGYSFIHLSSYFSGGFSNSSDLSADKLPNNNNNVFFGFGLKYKLSKQIYTRIQMERFYLNLEKYNLDNGKINMATLSFEFRF